MAANTLEYDFLLNLIENVHHNKCLYDKNDHFYFNKIKRNKAWDDIAKKTKRTSAECKARWKILRERYGRELKKPSGCEAVGDNSEWQMFRQMSFLKSSIKPRGKYDNKGEVEVKKNSPSEGEYSVTVSYDGFVEDTTNPILHSPVEQKHIPNMFASFADTASVASTPLSETEIKCKTKLDRLWDKFGNAMEKLEKSLETPIPTPNANDSDELFLRTMLSLMKGLPIDAKDKFASEMFTKLMQVRSENRSNV